MIYTVYFTNFGYSETGLTSLEEAKEMCLKKGFQASIWSQKSANATSKSYVGSYDPIGGFKL